MALTPEERNQFYYGNPPAQSSWTDYINPANLNIFATQNPMYEGLLGADQSKALSKQSNIAGLLGAAAALAQGMGKQGPKRSGFQNIIGALGAGYGAAGQQYQQGLQNFSTAQQLQANIDKQKAFADAAAKYPDLAPLARIDPGKFVEMVSQLEQQRPIAEAYKQAYGQQPVQQTIPQPDQTQYKQDLSAYKDNVNQMLGVGSPVSGGPITVTGGTAPVREPNAPLAAGTVEVNPVPEMYTGKYDASMPQMPVAPVTQPTQPVNKETELRNQKDTLLRVNANLSRLGTKAGNDEVKTILSKLRVLTLKFNNML